MKGLLSRMMPVSAPPIPDDEEEDVEYSFATEYDGPPVTYELPRGTCQTPSSLQSIACSSSRRRNRRDRALVCQAKQALNRSSLCRKTSTKLLRSVSCDKPKSRCTPIRRAFSASIDGFSDEEFAEQIRQLAERFSVGDEEDEENNINSGETSSNSNVNNSTRTPLAVEPLWLNINPETPDWEEIIPAIERKANSVDLPFSLRMIKKKTQFSEGFREVGESAYSSVKKAFSSMVFIIRELHSYTLQMRELLYYEDLQGVLARVQKEMNASFVWLFQQIFSQTPTLMVSVMILLANFTVHSMAHNIAIASPMSSGGVEIASIMEYQNENDSKFDSSAIKSFSISSSSGKTTSVGGINGGGGKHRQIASGTDGGDGRFDGFSSYGLHQIIPDEISQVSSFGNSTIESGVESEIRKIINEDKLWNSMVDEAIRMEELDEALDHEMMHNFISPIEVQIEPDDEYPDYLQTELLYQRAVSQEPFNSLILSNYAQFLYLVVHDHDRAEDYFKRASEVKPADAEALSKYATFLWMAKKDLTAAEETYLEAIEADPGNTYHIGNYAHFLWNTGGDDTCYPAYNA